LRAVSRSGPTIQGKPGPCEPGGCAGANSLERGTRVFWGLGLGPMASDAWDARDCWLAEGMPGYWLGKASWATSCQPECRCVGRFVIPTLFGACDSNKCNGRGAFVEGNKTEGSYEPWCHCMCMYVMVALWGTK